MPKSSNSTQFTVLMFLAYTGENCSRLKLLGNLTCNTPVSRVYWYAPISRGGRGLFRLTLVSGSGELMVEGRVSNYCSRK